MQQFEVFLSRGSVLGELTGAYRNAELKEGSLHAYLLHCSER